MYRCFCCDRRNQQPDIVSVLLEGGVQFIHGVFPKRRGRLFDEVLESRLNETSTGIIAFRQEIAELPGALESYFFPFRRDVNARRIDHLIVLVLTVPSDRIKIFECEAKAIDLTVTNLAIRFTGL